MLKGLARNSRIARFFASKPPAKQDSVDSDLAKKQKQAQSISTPPTEKRDYVKVDPKKFSLATSNLYDFLQNGYKVEELVESERKKYPLNISHFNPSSHDYIPSEYIEKTTWNEVSDYNKIIDNLKTDLKLMREYQEGVQKIIAKSKEKLERGNTRNVYDKVKEADGDVLGIEGEETGEWVLVDLADIVVHVMQPVIRSHYNLEELWQAAPTRRKNPADE